MIVPFPAEKDRTTLERIFSLLEEGSAPLPYNPKLPQKPTVTGNYRDSICLLTSGTTGTPKVAITSVESHRSAAKACPIPLGRGDGWLLNLPLFHVSGLAIAFRCLEFGAEMVFPGDDPTRVTHISCVPVQLQRMLKGEIPYPNLRTIVLGGSFIPPSLIQSAKARGYTVYTTYGMTETCAGIAYNGRLIPQTQAKLVDGELYVRGKTLFTGYASAPSPFVDGWFPTGDLATLKGDQVTITGRRDRMFISGGENIHPQEIEKALLSLKEVISARVEPQKCATFGSRPVAYLRTTKELSSDWLRQELEKLLIRWKIPSTFLQDIE